jgi:hypothetical protein
MKDEYFQEAVEFFQMLAAIVAEKQKGKESKEQKQGK